MAELEALIEYIRKARRQGFREDFIKKKLLDEGYPWRVVDDAFFGAGKPKRQHIHARVRSNAPHDKISHTILLEKWLKDALEKKAKEDGLTLYNEVKKILVESVGLPKGVFPSKIIRKKMTDEEKERHRVSDVKYRAKIEKERKEKSKIIRKNQRMLRKKAREKRRRNRKA